MTFDASFQLGDELREAHAEGEQPRAQFNDIDTAHPSLRLTDERLMNGKAARQGLLRQAGRQPGRTKLREKVTVVGRVRKGLHPRHRGSSFQPKIEYAKIG